MNKKRRIKKEEKTDIINLNNMIERNRRRILALCCKVPFLDQTK